MNYPEGQVEHPEGTYEWSMEDSDTIAVRGNPLLINQVGYEGIVSLKRDKITKEFAFLWGDAYFVRLNNGSPSGWLHTDAKIVFRDRVVEIANGADTDQTRHETKIAALEEERNKAASAVLELREEIEEYEDRIEEIEEELAQIEQS